MVSKFLTFSKEKVLWFQPISNFDWTQMHGFQLFHPNVQVNIPNFRRARFPLIFKWKWPNLISSYFTSYMSFSTLYYYILLFSAKLIPRNWRQKMIKKNFFQKIFKKIFWTPIKKPTKYVVRLCIRSILWKNEPPSFIG